MNTPTPLQTAWACKCPRCGQGDLYNAGIMSVKVQEQCPACNLKLAGNDSADGPAVFLIFILGFALVPLALLVEWLFGLALWVHALLWTSVALGLTLGMLRPLKAYVIALQFKHRPGDKNGL